MILMMYGLYLPKK